MDSSAIKSFRTADQLPFLLMSFLYVPVIKSINESCPATVTDTVVSVGFSNSMNVRAVCSGNQICHASCLVSLTGALIPTAWISYLYDPIIKFVNAPSLANLTIKLVLRARCYIYMFG